VGTFGMSDAVKGMKIGWVGLGNMGLPMAGHLHTAGAEVIVWNRSAVSAEAAAAQGMRRAESLAELAASVGDGIVCLCLTTPDVVAAAVTELVGALGAKALVIDFGTTGVPTTKRLAERIRWVDAPMSGGQVGAEAGNLTIMAGGTGENFARAKPLLEVVGGRVTHLGPVGSGQVAKLANQLIVAQAIDAVAQAMRLAELSGVEAGKLREALLGGFADSRILDLHGDRMARRDFVPGGKAAWQLKDVRLICELAESVGFQSPTLDNCRRQWERFVDELGGGDLDHSGLFTMYAGCAGEFE
jgi:2-hydroxy-3-oxopropionate reductase